MGLRQPSHEIFLQKCASSWFHDLFSENSGKWYYVICLHVPSIVLQWHDGYVLCVRNAQDSGNRKLTKPSMIRCEVTLYTILRWLHFISASHRVPASHQLYQRGFPWKASMFSWDCYWRILIFSKYRPSSAVLDSLTCKWFFPSDMTVWLAWNVYCSLWTP